MFGCEETQRYVDAWLDGELDPGAALHVEAHVGRCAACRDEADTIKALKRSMAALRETHAAPGALKNRLRAALDEVDREGERAVQTAKRKRHATGFLMAGAAVAGIVLAAGRDAALRGGLRVSSAGVVPPVLEDIAMRHARDLPAEVNSSQPEQVASFFRGRLDIPVRPVAFRGVPAHLIGARISNVRDHMAAALYYDVGGRRVTVFVFDPSLLPKDEDARTVRRVVANNRPVYVANAHGYSVAFAEYEGVGYALASDLPPQDAVRIVQQVELQ